MRDGVERLRSSFDCAPLLLPGSVQGICLDRVLQPWEGWFELEVLSDSTPIE